MGQEPGARFAQTFLLLDEIDRAARNLRPLPRTVEEVTGLTPAQARVLMGLLLDGKAAINSTTDPSTLRSLADRGLIASTGPQHSARSTNWRLTSSGQASVDQLQGLRIRIINTVMVETEDRQVHVIQDALQGISHALPGLRLNTE